MKKGASEAQVTRFSWILDMYGDLAKRDVEKEDPCTQSFDAGYAAAVKALTDEFNEVFEIAPKEDEEDEDADHRDMMFFAEDLRREVEDAAC